MKYNWSKYNKFIKQDNLKLLYNSLSGIFWELDEESYSDLNNLKTLIENNEYNDLHSIHDTLVENGIITKFTQDDVLNRFKVQRLLEQTDKSILALSVLTTLNCNFNCHYCYESSRPDISINEDVQDKILEFIKMKTPIESLRIDWLGGEPLLEFNRIRTMTKRIKEFDEIKNYSASIITNGYLLTKDICDELIELNINFIQITIDGIAEVHNKRRPHIKNKDSYETIIENLKYLYQNYNEKIQLAIRINVDKTNAGSYHNTCKQLKQYFPKIKPHAGIVTETNTCTSINNCNFTRFDQVEFIKENKREHDINVFPLFPKEMPGICMAEALNSFVIGPEGLLFKCWNDVGIEERAIGSLIDNNKKNNSTVLYNYLVGCNPLEDAKCKNCFSLPHCNGGGCVYKREKSKFGDHKIDYCSYFKDNLEEFLVMHYEDRIKNIAT